jgi:hypothetical protein
MVHPIYSDLFRFWAVSVSIFLDIAQKLLKIAPFWHKCPRCLYNKVRYFRGYWV